MKPLTEVQTRYINTIEDYWKRHGYGPTQKDISVRLDTCPSAVASMLKKLVERNYLIPAEYEPRLIRTTRTKVKVVIGAWPTS